MDCLKETGELNEPIQHQKVIAGTALFMATIVKNLFREFPLEQSHCTVVHGLSIQTIKLKAPKGKSS